MRGEDKARSLGDTDSVHPRKMEDIAKDDDFFAEQVSVHRGLVATLTPLVPPQSCHLALIHLLLPGEAYPFERVATLLRRNSVYTLEVLLCLQRLEIVKEVTPGSLVYCINLDGDWTAALSASTQMQLTTWRAAFLQDSSRRQQDGTRQDPFLGSARPTHLGYRKWRGYPPPRNSWPLPPPPPKPRRHAVEVRMHRTKTVKKMASRSTKSRLRIT